MKQPKSGLEALLQALADGAEGDARSTEPRRHEQPARSVSSAESPVLELRERQDQKEFASARSTPRFEASSDAVARLERSEREAEAARAEAAKVDAARRRMAAAGAERPLPRRATLSRSSAPSVSAEAARAGVVWSVVLGQPRATAPHGERGAFSPPGGVV